MLNSIAFIKKYFFSIIFPIARLPGCTLTDLSRFNNLFAAYLPILMNFFVIPNFGKPKDFFTIVILGINDRMSKTWWGVGALTAGIMA